MKSKRTTVKDIAELAGVSRGTVDRVLHERGKVAPHVKLKVQQAIESLEYKPNLVARSMATQKTYTIACLLPFPDEDPFWHKPQIGIDSAHQEIIDFGVEIEQFHFSLFDPISFKRSAAALLETNPDAVLIATEFYSQAEAFFQEATERKLPVLCINTLITEFPTLGYIGQDSFQSGVLAGRLFDMTIPTLNGILTLNVGAKSIEQKHLLHKEQGLRYYFDQKEKNVRITEIDLMPLSEIEKVEELLKAELEPLIFQGIFITNSRSYQIIPILKKLGYSDQCIIGFDLLEQNKAHLQKGDIDFIINQDPIMQGSLAIKSLFNFLLNKEQPQKLHFLPLDIVVKENCDYYN